METPHNGAPPLHQRCGATLHINETSIPTMSHVKKSNHHSDHHNNGHQKTKDDAKDIRERKSNKQNGTHSMACQRNVCGHLRMESQPQIFLFSSLHDNPRNCLVVFQLGKLEIMDTFQLSHHMGVMEEWSIRPCGHFITCFFVVSAVCLHAPVLKQVVNFDHGFFRLRGQETAIILDQMKLCAAFP
mmetsp:Transcript_14132/g.30806  ORF Transcript_14132/g.30806 Transcript_14132/m.30806 type:complete len:186 (-) Transcript_14132:581-1138(-)